MSSPWWQRRVWRATVAADDACEMLCEGDIFLLSGLAPTERCLQCALRTRFHHVGVLVHLGGEMCVLESGLDGVIKWPVDVFLDGVNWERVRRRHGAVAVRRLLIDGRVDGLTMAQRHALRRYASAMLGHGYVMSPAKPLSAFMRVKQRPTARSLEGADLPTRAFCSELVAGCYKAMGLLPTAVAAADYLPSDFALSTPGRLPLLLGASLTSKLHVVFLETRLLEIVR